MYIDTVCEGCRTEEYTVEHTLECKALIGPNEIVTHLPLSEDIYDNDEYEEVYIARTLKDNMRILPLHCGPCEPA